MQVGLFLDIDDVITDAPANMQYAKMLGVDSALQELETQYAAGEIDNNGFNRTFIPLFQKTAFNRDWAKQHYSQVVLRSGASELLSRDEKPYLVTSGPSYFVEQLAERYHIPADRVLCSKYEFDEAGSLSHCARPVGASLKGTWVAARARKYTVSVGVGDTPEVDRPFLVQCTLPILMNRLRDEFLCIRSLHTLNDLLEALESAA